jgi:ribosome-associated translation inhibitor RaiA
MLEYKKVHSFGKLIPEAKGGRMETPFKSSFDLSNVSPEVKSYIYQTILEFEPYTTAETVVAVVAKDPLKLISQLEADGQDCDRTELKRMYRISISLMEDGAKIEEEGLAEDIYDAIKIAKDKLVAVLSEIQDSVVSSQDRTVQINSLLQHSGTIH